MRWLDMYGRSFAATGRTFKVGVRPSNCQVFWPTTHGAVSVNSRKQPIMIHK